jgi:hypothetical protein
MGPLHEQCEVQTGGAAAQADDFHSGFLWKRALCHLVDF